MKPLPLVLLLSAVPMSAVMQTPASAVDAPSLQARTVTAGGDQIVPLFAQVRFTTLLRLPADEEIVEVTCGDKEFWAVNVTGNLLAVKPAKAGASTNLNVLTARATVYAFQLMEVSGRKGDRPDGTVTVQRDTSAAPGTDTKPLFVARRTVDAIEQERDEARRELQRVTLQKEGERQDAVTAYRRSYPSTLRFPYRFKGDVEPFCVRAMWHDERTTYIQATPRQAPTLYEWQNGQPSLVNFEYRDGLYIIPKILDRGHLVLGKARWTFERAAAR
jgi:type IV secretion system protein VirB9